MLNSEKTGLAIFDNFQIDWRLPKWEKKRKALNEAGPSGTPQINFPRTLGRNRDGGLGVFNGPMQVVPAVGWNGNTWVNSGMGYAQDKKETKDSLWAKVFNRKKIKARIEAEKTAKDAANFVFVTPDGVDINPPPVEDESKVELPVEEFFKSMANSPEEITIIEGRLKSYEDAITYLKKTGQEAVEEHMMSELEIIRAESQLFALGMVKLVTEKQIVEFAGKSSKKVKLDWIKNFTRQIPSTVIDVKVKVDERDIFDNYVVMHYDPDNKGTADTQAEKARKRDPILFGVLVGSFKLYYIGDWKDDFCDLTFDKLVETLGGEEAMAANNITATVSAPNDITENFN